MIKKITFGKLQALLVFFIVILLGNVHSMNKESSQISLLEKIGTESNELIYRVFTFYLQSSKNSIEMFKRVALLRCLNKNSKKIIDKKYPEFTQFFGNPCDDEQFEIYIERLFDWLYTIKGSINSRGLRGRTLLHAAVLKNNQKMVKGIKALGGALLYDSLDFAPYHHSLSYKNNAQLRLLLESDTDRDPIEIKTEWQKMLRDQKYIEAKKTIPRNCSEEVIDWLISTIYEKKTLEDFFLYFSLLSKLSNIRGYMFGEITHALEVGNSAASNILIGKLYEDYSNNRGNPYGKILTVSVRELISEAIKNGLLNEVKQLRPILSSSDDSNCGYRDNNSVFDESDITSACEYGHLNMVQYIFEVEKNLDIDCFSYDRTPLMEACSYGQLHIVRYLLDKGADINKCNKKGGAAMVYACEKGWLNIVKYLIKRGSVISLKALSRACYYGRLNIVKYFVTEKKIDINVQDDNQNTLLMAAASGGRCGLVKYLLDIGADPTKRDKFGWLARHSLSSFVESNLPTINYLKEKELEFSQINKVENVCV